MSSKENRAENLRCPVCESLSEDQCFVCPHHHTLCRTCYQSIVRTRPPGGALCPMCRTRMTHPVENSDRRSLVRRVKQEKASQKQEDAVELEKRCKQLVKIAETAAYEAEVEEAVVKKEFDGIIDRCCEELRRQQAEVSETLSSTSLVSRLQADAIALGAALDAEDLREASFARDQLVVDLSEVKGLERLIKSIIYSYKLNCPVKLPDSVDDVEQLRSKINEEIQLRHLASSRPEPQQMSLVLQMRNSIDAHVDRIVATVRRSRSCQAEENGEDCRRRSFQHCNHCSRDLCQVHFSKDRLEFENDCRRLLMEAAEVQSSKTLEKWSAQLLQKWNVKIMRSVDELEKRLCQVRASLASTAPARKLRAEAAALNGEPALSGLKNALKAADRLSAALLQREETRLENLKLVKPTESACLLSREASLADTVTKVELLCKLQPLEQRRCLVASVKAIQAEKAKATKLCCIDN